MKTYTSLDCELWRQNPTVNPKTRRRISPKGKVYKDYQKACDAMLLVTPSRQSVKMSFGRANNIICTVVPKRRSPSPSSLKKYRSRSPSPRRCCSAWNNPPPPYTPPSSEKYIACPLGTVTRNPNEFFSATSSFGSPKFSSAIPSYSSSKVSSSGSLVPMFF